MKKKIESELRTIAKRILDSEDTLDTASLRTLTAQLYERVLVLNYLEQQSERSEAAPKATVSSSMDSKSYREQNWFNDPKPVPQPTYSEEIAEPLIEKIKDIVAQIPQESEKVDDLLNELLPKKENSKNELENLAALYQETPIFERKDPVGEESDLSTDHGMIIKPNERHSFVDHLFDNNQEDLIRVLSQINSMRSFEEAKTFISGQIKPEYNNWKNKEDYENRFMNLIEKHFS
jgi:hypothetical protein